MRELHRRLALQSSLARTTHSSSTDAATRGAGHLADQRPLVDWRRRPRLVIIDQSSTRCFPMTSSSTAADRLSSRIAHVSMALRTRLERRRLSAQTNARSEDSWWEYPGSPLERNRTPLSITFAEVATHNHFVLDRGGKVFNQTAPVIKLPARRREDDHLACSASSTARPPASG